MITRKSLPVCISSILPSMPVNDLKARLIVPSGIPISRATADAARQFNLLYSPGRDVVKGNVCNEISPERKPNVIFFRDRVKAGSRYKHSPTTSLPGEYNKLNC